MSEVDLTGLFQTLGLVGSDSEPTELGFRAWLDREEAIGEVEREARKSKQVKRAAHEMKMSIGQFTAKCLMLWDRVKDRR